MLFCLEQIWLVRDFIVIYFIGIRFCERNGINQMIDVIIYVFEMVQLFIKERYCLRIYFFMFMCNIIDQVNSYVIKIVLLLVNVNVKLIKRLEIFYIKFKKLCIL